MQIVILKPKILQIGKIGLGTSNPLKYSTQVALTECFRYIVHKMYSLPFEVSPSVIDKDCLMIPAGWDTLHKISILNDTLRSFNLEDDLNTVSNESLMSI